MRLVILLAFCASSAAAASSTSATPIKIMPLGDSITRGFGSIDSGGYRRPLYNMLTQNGWNVDFVGLLNHGYFPEPEHEGWDGAYIRVLQQNRAVPAHQTYMPNITLLMAGTNDVWHGTGLNSPANAPANLDSLIATIYAVNPTTHLYVASIPRIWDGNIGIEYQRVVDYNVQIPGIVDAWAATGKSIRFVDVYPFVTRAQLLDGVHPRQAGYVEIAKVFYNALTHDDLLKSDRDARVNRPFQGVLIPEPAAGAALLPMLLISLRRRRFFR